MEQAHPCTETTAAILVLSPEDQLARMAPCRCAGLFSGGAMLTLTVAPPPSVNSLYPGKARRYKSDAYKRWIDMAEWQIKLQRPKPFQGEKYGALYLIPDTVRGDLANREKALTDLLVSMELVPDDKHLAPLIMDWHGEKDAKVIIDSPEAFRFQTTTIPHLGPVV